MNPRYIDPISDPGWDQFIKAQAGGTIFHTSAWARVISETYGYEPRYLVSEDAQGAVQAAMPQFLIRSRLTGNRLICLPFSDYCFPLGDNEAINQLLETGKQIVRSGQADYLEIRNWQNEATPGQDLKIRDYFLLYLLDLQPGPDAVKTNLHQSIRRGIKQAENRGVTVRISYDLEGVDSFHKLNIRTRKKLGVLPQPYKFFTSIHSNIISENLGFTILAEYQNKVIAAVVFLVYKDTLYYKYSASDPAYLSLRPNNLVIWKAITHGCNQGLTTLDFGRCTPEEEGLRVFKSRWGASENKLPYWYYPQAKGFTVVPENSFKHRAMKAFSHTVPESVLAAIGSRLYKHVA